MENLDKPQNELIPVSELDQFHRHELLDRISCFNNMFEKLISEHPAASLMRKAIDDAGSVLADLYQIAGNVRFPEE